jgi:hypothetical protein
MSDADGPTGPVDFIRARIAHDVREGKNAGRVVTRFPPEPNGYLHIGHAKSICLNFGIASEYPAASVICASTTRIRPGDPEFVEAIKEDVRWLGFDWGERLTARVGLLPSALRLAVAADRGRQGLRRSLSTPRRSGSTAAR